MRITDFSLWLGLSLSLLACSPTEDAQLPDTSDISVPDSTLDVPSDTDSATLSCTSNADCEAYAGCCYNMLCINRACVPSTKADCCEFEGACAVQPMMLHRGECVQTCEAYGCEHWLKLNPTACDIALWQWQPSQIGLGDLFQSTSNGPHIGWHRSEVRPFLGQPSLRFGHVLCPNFHESAQFPGCEPAPDGNVVRGYLETPAVGLPSEFSSLAELWLYFDVGQGAGQLDLSIVPEGSSPIVLWQGTRLNLEASQWQPVLVDLSSFAGRTIRLRLLFDSRDGRNLGGEGVSLAKFAIRSACEGDRQAGPDSLCERSLLTPVQRTSDALYVDTPFWQQPDGTPGDYGRACEACTTELSCRASAQPCEQVFCEQGRCTYAAIEGCCTDRTIPLASFDEPAWTLEGAWQIDGQSPDGAQGLLQFGDGQALAPEGEIGQGQVFSPLMSLDEAYVWRFDLWLQTEWDAFTGPFVGDIDLLEAIVKVYPEGSAIPQEIVVWRSEAIGGTTSGGWKNVEIDLSSLKGRLVSVGWRFQTGDAERNAPGGVWVRHPQFVSACMRQ